MHPAVTAMMSRRTLPRLSRRSRPGALGRWVDEGDRRGGTAARVCAAPLWLSIVGRQFEGAHGEKVVVVAYRSASEEASTLPLYECPRCGKLLRLWWTVEGRDGHAGCAW